MSRNLRRVIALGTALILTLSLALPALAADPTGSNASTQTETNTAVMNQSTVAISGSATAGTGGTATTGDVVASASASQSQSNVQVGVNAAVSAAPVLVTGVTPTATPVPTTATATNTSDQLATNVAQVNQTAAATSGDAVAAVVATQTTSGTDSFVSQGPSATSGDVSVQLAAAQSQDNTQVVVNAAAPLWSLGSTAEATSAKTQTASNAALADQAAAGISGDATGVGLTVTEDTDDLYGATPEKRGGTEATSGDVTISALSEQSQSNVQVALNAAVTAYAPGTTATATNAGSQTADNLECVTQDLAGISGAATAIATTSDDKYKEKGGQASATSGDVDAAAYATQSQLNVQVDANAAVAIDSRDLDADLDTSATADSAVTQTASNDALITQGVAGVSGDALAVGATPSNTKSFTLGKTSATTGDVTAAATASQAQQNWQIAINAAVLYDSDEGVADATNTSLQDASNGAFVDQALAGFSGAASAAGEVAKASSGDVDVSASAGQEQWNGQAVGNAAVVIGSDYGLAVATNDSTQTASNTAVQSQDLAAISGDALAAGFAAFAGSGDVAASASTYQKQVNGQIALNAAVLYDSYFGAAGAANLSAQDAFNEGRIAQTETAASGPATAVGDLTFAFSGDVATYASAAQLQKNIQAVVNAAALVFADYGVALATNDSVQSAGNLARIGQSVLGLSGAADALGILAYAASGDVLAGASVGQQAQTNLQLMANIALQIYNLLGLADSANFADQLATSNLLACQAAAAASGDALAAGTLASTTTGYSEATTSGSQLDDNAELLIQINGEISAYSGLLALLAP